MIHDTELRLDIRLYLTFLQNTITRMGDYGKTCKQFSITILTSWFVFIGVLVSENKLSNILLISWILIPIIFLWLVNTFFLKTERQYRNKYNEYVNQLKNSLKYTPNDTISIIDNLYNMIPVSSTKNNNKIYWCSVFFSETLLLTYGSQIYVWIFFCGLVVGLLK